MLPTTRARIEDEERRIGVRLPDPLRSRLLAENGGVLRVAGIDWDLNPVRDPSSRRTAGPSAAHIERETLSAREADIGLPPDAIVTASDIGGNMLLLSPSGDFGIWWLDEFLLEPVIVDWANPRNAPRGNPWVRAFVRIETQIERLGADDVLVLAAPKGRAQIRLQIEGDEIVARLAGGGGERAVAPLRHLGWSGPYESGSWHRRWTREGLDPRRVAIISVDTLTKVYRCRPDAIDVEIEAPA